MAPGTRRVPWLDIRRAACAALAAVGLFTGVAGRLRAEGAAPVAPDTAPRPSEIRVDWDRFDRLAEVARQTGASDRLTDVARALKGNVPGEAGRLTPLDWYCLGCSWCAYHDSGAKGRAYLRDASALEGEELYALIRKGYRFDREQAVRIEARLLTMLGVPTEVMTGLVRARSLDRGAWVLSQVGPTWMRADITRCLPAQNSAWRPGAAFFQASTDLDGVLMFLSNHLPDGDLTARQQGLKRQVSLSEWEAWSRTETRLRESAKSSVAELLYVQKTGLFTPSPVSDADPREFTISPPTAVALSALEQLRRRPVRPTRGAYLAATARKYVGLPYVWGGENPDRGFDCSGLVQYVCRTWGISVPRTAAEQYHLGSPVGFMDLEPGDLIFLANTYKPGVSHVGMYIGDGLWVQAVGTGIGITVGDVPYFDAGNGPGARRLNLGHLPRIAGERIPDPLPSRSSVFASRHSTQARNALPPPSQGGIVSVKVCGDTGALANSGCDTYKLVRMPRSQARAIPRCRRHRPRSGERW